MPGGLGRIAWACSDIPGSTIAAAAAQVLADGHAARDYQDERFSYVILRRGHRPNHISVQHIARAAAGDLEVPKQSYSPDVVQVRIETLHTGTAELHRWRTGVCILVMTEWWQEGALQLARAMQQCTTLATFAALVKPR